MARAPIVEPRSAIDYDDRGVRAMHTVLIELGQILGPYRDAIVVVGGRDKAKDAYDIYFCVRSFPGGPRALAAESMALLTDPIALTGYQKIAAKFRSDDDFGPHTVNKFLGESSQFENMTPEQLRTDAYRQIRVWLNAMQITE
jgi:hypothetical protein